MIFLGAFPGTQVNSSRQNNCLFSFTWFSLPQIYFIAYSSIRFSMLLPQNSFSVTYPFLIKSWLLLSPYPFAAILSLSFPHILHLMQTFACLPGSALWQPWGSGQWPSLSADDQQAVHHPGSSTSTPASAASHTADPKPTTPKPKKG